MIVKAEDFKGTAAIPNGIVNAPNQDLLGNVTQLQEAIDEFEEEALTIILGYSLGKEFASKFDANGDLSAGEDSKWEELKNGKDNYRGIVKAVVHYIFFKFIENDEAHYSMMGVGNDKSKGMEKTSINYKAVKAWNIFYEHSVGSTPFRTVIHKPWATGVIYSSSDELYKCIRQFVDEDTTGLFDAKSFTNIENINIYGF